MFNKFRSWFIITSAVIFLTACQSDERNARIQVYLTDAPGDYQEVNVDIQGVEIHSEANGAENGWRSLSTTTGVYNLLELTNGLDTLLGQIEVPAGKISQIRLKLGNNNSIKVGDEVFDLSTPSGQQSGLKIQVQESFTEGVTYKILLDFDVARSIVTTGNGGYSLKPVIRSIVTATSGSIKGVIDPIEAHPAIYAIDGLDTLGTTYSDSTGHFLLRGIPSGSYTLVFKPGSDYVELEKTAVEVETGSLTDVGTVTISLK